MTPPTEVVSKMVNHTVPIYRTPEDETDRYVTAQASASSEPMVRRGETAWVGIDRVLMRVGDATPSWVEIMQTAEVQMIRDLQDALDLDASEIARAVGVSEQDLDGFLAGRLAVPQVTQRRVRMAHAALGRLLRIFRRTRLRDVVRRISPAFGDRTALQLILDGQIDHVAETYDDALTYQP